MKRTFVINGNNIHDISSFYAEINRVFMADEDWKIGHSLDALNDLLYGGIGALPQGEPVTLLWEHCDKSRQALGPEATSTWYQQKLEQGKPYNTALLLEKLADLEKGKGLTFFDMVMEIVSGHANINLVEA